MDFGAGAGEFSNRFSGRDITAYEPDRHLAKKIQVHTVTRMHDITGSFDFIFMVNVLEHIEDDSEVLRRVGGMLSEGGKIFIFVPAFEHLYSVMDREVGHIRRYTKQGLVKLLENNGFAINTCQYFDFLGYFCTWAYKFVSMFRKRGKSSLSPKSMVIYDSLVFPFSRLIDRATTGGLIGKNIILEVTKGQ